MKTSEAPVGGVTPYPAEFADRYRQAGLWRDETIPQAFRRTAAQYPDAPAVVTESHRWTYSELLTRSDNIAAGLLATGLEPGSAVILQLTNTAHTIAAWYALLRAGLRPVCSLAIHRRHEISAIARLTGAVAHVVQADLKNFDLVDFAVNLRADHPRLTHLLTVGATADAPGIRIEDLEARERSAADNHRLDQVEKAVDLAALAILQLSGGTTGTPKVIPRLHPEYWHNGVAVAAWSGFGAGDVIAFGLPIVHNAGIANALYGSHSVGATLVLGTPAADSLLPLMASEQATWLMTHPGVMRGYLEHNDFAAAFAKVRTCVLTAAPVARELFDQLEEHGLHITQAFGMTEGMFLFTPTHAPADLRAGSIGLPISPYDEIKLLEPGTDTEVAPGQPGELCVRGPYTIRGYLAERQRNRQAFTPDGFYRSGDIATRTEIAGQQTYVLSGRIKDLINRGGEKINAEELENLLAKHESVSEIAVVAMPDTRLGEKVAAVVVVAPERPEPKLTDLCDYLAACGVAKYKWPEYLQLTETLPRTQIGKVDKRKLREQIVAAAAAR